MTRINLKPSDYEDGLDVEQYLQEEALADIFYKVADPYTQKIIHAVFRLGFSDGVATCLDDANQQANDIYERAYNEGYEEGYQEGEF